MLTACFPADALTHNDLNGTWYTMRQTEETAQHVVPPLLTNLAKPTCQIWQVRAVERTKKRTVAKIWWISNG